MYIKWSVQRRYIPVRRGSQSSLPTIHSQILILIRRFRFQLCYIFLACCFILLLLLLLSYEKYLLLSCIYQWNLFHLPSSSSSCSTLRINEDKTKDSILVMNSQRIQNKKNTLTIEISLVVGGAQAARQLVTLIKSVLIQRNWQSHERRITFTTAPSTMKSITSSISTPVSYSVKNKDGISSLNTDNTINCYLRQINLHLLVDYQASKSLRVLFKTWNILNMNVYYYQLEDYMHKVSWIPSTHYSGLFGLSKLLIPEILPDSVEKVISLDVDLLVNSDLQELWNYFSEFNSTQMIGLVANQSPWYLRKTNRVVWPAWGPGFNTGVMLLDLVRLRKFHWSEHWHRTTKSALLRISHATLADQDIINAALVEYPSAFMNYPVNGIWFNSYLNDYTEHIDEEKFQSFYHLLKIAHFNHPIKPDMISLSEIIDDDHSRLILRKQFVRMYRFYQNLDGDLVKSPIEPTTCLKFAYNTNTPIKKLQQLTKNNITIKGCEEFQENMFTTHRIHPYFLNYQFYKGDNETNAENHVSLVSQLTFDRLHRLEELSMKWLGPISLALYLTDREATLLVEFVTNSKILQNRTNIGYHIVYVDGKFYPINTLRNIAIRYSITEFIFHIDIDFIPQANMIQRAETSILEHLIQNNKSQNICLVVPAFETFKNHLSLPETKENLLKSWEIGEILPFRHEIWSAGHMSTNYSHWKSVNMNYEVQWSADYEPYVIISRYAVNFDESFIGFGWNKASYIMALDALGYKFIVLANVFLIHLPHPPSFEVFRYRMNLAYRSCIDKLKLDFIKRLAKQHGVQALKYLQFRKDSHSNET
ncbi:unnamed protein product [Heterobilharzia americana]|nr:unnamed protein product [Heterobilharzia americana]